MLRSATETIYLNVIEDVINKTRYSRVTGELEESILNEFQKIWEAKMIKAGIISRPIPLPTPTPLETQNPTYLHGSAGNPYLTDRSTDMNVQSPRLNPYTDLVAIRKIKRDGFPIPQQDGGGTGVGDGLNVPVNIEKNKDVCKEDEPDLNEGDDDREEDIEKDTPHLVLAQFDMVKRSKNHWKCILKSSIMLLNDKDVLFSEATVEFKF